MGHNIDTKEFLAVANKRQDPPACNKEFTLTITYSMVVQDCSNITEDERRHMMEGLSFNFQSSAGALCKQNQNCPKLTTTGFNPKSQSCAKGSDGKFVWTVIADITGKCIPV